MDPHSHVFDPESLSEHSEWVRALARSLVRDPGTAEDIAQETWIATLRHPPTEGHSARAWLTTVTKNKARQIVRARERRSHHERHAASGDAPPSDRELAERVALQEWVVRAVMDLDEPYRRTILLRFFESMPPRKIATAMGVPLETVKTRLKRAIARLRDRIETQRGPGGARGLHLLLPLVAPTPWSAASGVGIVLMGKKGLLLIATVLMMLLSGTYYAGLLGPKDTSEVAGITREDVGEDVTAGELTEGVETSDLSFMGAGHSETPTPVTVAEDLFLLRTIESDNGLRGSLPVLSAAPSVPLAQDGGIPPGLVLIKGGRTKVGNDVKDVEKMIDEDLTVRTKVRTLDSTTPQLLVTIPNFYMGLTEVTNEQYLEYVKATGTRPLHYWAGEAVEAARIAFVNNKDRPKGASFVSAEWWVANWEESEWEAPTGIDLLRPVNFVNYMDALGYCAWAGLRLPTEEEFQRACRGNGEDIYPWGDEWEDGKFAATSEMRSVKQSFPAGFFPAGASNDGLLDLSGNVWEWTTSAYSAYKGWKTGNVYNVGEGRRAEILTPESSWSPANQVVVGGCYVTNRVAAMCTIRRSTERRQKSRGMGFRAAASPEPGRDLADSIYQSHLRHSRARAEGVLFELKAPVSMNHWSSRTTDASPDDVKSERLLKDYSIPEDYRVITGYEHVLFATRDALPQSGSDVLLSHATLREAQQIGFISLSSPMLEPALEPGVYLVAYRAKGKFIPVRGTNPNAVPNPDKPEHTDRFEGLIDFEKPNILLLDSDSGELVAHFPLVSALTIKKGKGGGTFTQVETKRWIKDDEGEDLQLVEQWLNLDVQIPTSQSRRYLPVSFRMRPAAGFFNLGWKTENGK